MTSTLIQPRAKRWFWAVLLLAAVVRVAVGVWRGEALMHAGNGLYYMDWLADSLASGRGYSVDGIANVFQQPAYIFALAGGYALLGAGWKAVLAVNAAIGVCLVAVVMRLAAHLDVRAAIPAGLLAAVHPVIVWHGNSVADTTMFALALAGWLHGTLATMQDGRWRTMALAGLWLGLACLTRPSLLPLVPLGVLAVGWSRRSWRDMFTYAGVLLVVAGALTLPWMLRNHALTGAFPLIGTHGPESVWAANNRDAPEATELDSSYDAISETHEGTELDVTEFQAFLTPDAAVRRERLFRETARSWIAAHPREFVSMCVVRLGRIWDPRYHPMRWGRTVVPGSYRKNAVHRLVHGGVLLLAVIGLAMLLHRRETRAASAFVLATLIVYSVAHSVGAGYSRVRFPLDPVLAALAACALVRVRSRRGMRASPP